MKRNDKIIIPYHIKTYHNITYHNITYAKIQSNQIKSSAREEESFLLRSIQARPHVSPPFLLSRLPTYLRRNQPTNQPTNQKAQKSGEKERKEEKKSARGGTWTWPGRGGPLGLTLLYFILSGLDLDLGAREYVLYFTLGDGGGEIHTAKYIRLRT